jgi:hypothetical protein
MSREYHNTVDDGPHVVAYVSRSKVTDWKRLMSPRTGKAFPFVYGSNDENVFAPTVKEGSVLWVIGATPDDRPPSLVARLNVIGRLDPPGEETFGIPHGVVRTFRKKFHYIAVGDSNKSRFYGHNDASRALLGLVLKWVHRERTLSGEKPCPQGTCVWKPSYATPLNRPATIVSDPKPMIDLDASADRCVFISWKRSDNWTRRASIRKLAYALADERVFSWLDVLAFPPSIALRTKVDPNRALIRRLLKYGYKHCGGLLAIETKEYGNKGISGNWTKMEWTGNLDVNEPPCPPPLRWVYRFEESAFLANFVQVHNRLMQDIEWSEVAKNIRGEMDSSVPPHEQPVSRKG